MKKIVLLTGLFFCCVKIVSYAQPGQLDTSFGDFGIAERQPFISEFKSCVIQEDGKIVLVGRGYYDNGIVRYNNDGTIDLNFGAEGSAGGGFYSTINAVAIQPDGRIVVAGNTYFGDSCLLARFNEDGSLDNSFGNNGELSFSFDGQQNSITSIAIQSDGKIVASFLHTYALARFNINGRPDTSFSNDGIITSSGSFYNGSVVIQSNGKIIVRTNDGPVRYNVDGTIDKTFDTADPLFSERSKAIQSDGKLVVVGSFTNYTYTGCMPGRFGIVRYNNDGTLDKTFSGDGKQTTIIKDKLIDEGAFSVAIQSDGKIIVGGTIYDIGGQGVWPSLSVLVRYNTDGSLDSSFSDDGIKIIVMYPFGYINVLAIFNDKLYAVNYNSLARFLITESKVTSVNITTPNEDNNKYRNPATINITARATNPNGEITKVEFYNGTALLSTDYSSPYTYKWENVPIGTYSLSAKATDNVGLVVTSAVIDAIVVPNETPAVRIITPFDSSIHLRSSIEFRMMATDQNGILKYLQFYDDKTLLQTYAPAQPHNEYDFRIKKIYTEGNHKLIAKVTDIFGGTNTDTVTITVTNKFPTVNIASPTDNNTYTELATIPIHANADKYPGGTVLKVEFYNNTTLLYIDNTYPYDYNWTNAPLGNYSLTAVAIYSSNLILTSPVVRGTVISGKTSVSLTIPDNIVKYTAPARIKFNAKVEAGGGRVSKVGFYLNGAYVLHNEFQIPYGFLWVNVPAGNYTITTKVTDDKGVTTTSNDINVSVVNENVPPVVSIVSPVNDTTYTGPATIHLMARAKDPNDRISKVEWYNGTTLIRTEKIYPYAITWNNVQPGTYTITAIATDDKGLSATSDPVTVTVEASNVLMINGKLSVSNRTDLNGFAGVRLSPNPAGNILQIYTNGLQQNKPSTISVISVSGVVIKTVQTISNQVMQIDVSSLRPGVYFVKVLSGNKVLYTPFVKL